jgi:hypothetical protein
MKGEINMRNIEEFKEKLNAKANDIDAWLNNYINKTAREFEIPETFYADAKNGSWTEPMDDLFIKIIGCNNKNKENKLVADFEALMNVYAVTYIKENYKDYDEICHKIDKGVSNTFNFYNNELVYGKDFIGVLALINETDSEDNLGYLEEYISEYCSNLNYDRETSKKLCEEFMMKMNMDVFEAKKFLDERGADYRSGIEDWNDMAYEIKRYKCFKESTLLNNLIEMKYNQIAARNKTLQVYLQED